uniref:VanZ family protein n=1 Tax=Lachnospira sp. TaxID=2049031 RepID=UPI003FEF2A77
MKKEFNHKAVMKLLFIIYMCVLVYVVFFAEAMGRTPQDGYVYNLTPLKEIKRFMKYIWDNDALGRAARLNIFGNIIAFIPFGIYLPYTSESKLGFISTVLYTFSLSLTIELVQLITKVGSCDVDDIILNALGGVIGYILWYIYTKLRKK